MTGDGYTVMLCDDEDGVRRVVERLLRRQGYDVLLADTGPRALEVARAHDGPLEVLVTDVVLPGMSGPALAAELRLERPGIAVLYASGYGSEVVEEEADDETVEFLEKPFTEEVLLDRVHAAAVRARAAP